jgi:flagellar basal body-associated protein FliL
VYRKFGLVLLIGTFLSALGAITLLMWIFYRSQTDPKTPENEPKPTPRAVIVYQEPLTAATDYTLVDARAAGSDSVAYVVSAAPDADFAIAYTNNLYSHSSDLVGASASSV